MFIYRMEKLIKRKKIMTELKIVSYNALDNIISKLDSRTVAADRKKIYASNRVDTLEKFIKIFNDININKQNGEIVTIGKINQDKKIKNEKVRVEDAEFKNTKKLLLRQLKEQTFEQKFKSEQKERTINDRKALSGIYKKSFVYAGDIDGLNDFNAYNQTMAYDVIYRMILKDFKQMTSDRKYKCTLKTFIVIKVLMYRIQQDENGNDYDETEHRWFNSFSFDVLSLNNINGITNSVINGFNNF